MCLVVIPKRMQYQCDRSHLRCLRSSGRVAVGLTGNPDSDFQVEADQVIDWGAGGEQVGYVTQGVVTLILFCACLLCGLRKRNSEARRCNAQDEAELKAAIDAHGEAVHRSEAWVETNYALITSMSQAYVLGAGASYGANLWKAR